MTRQERLEEFISEIFRDYSVLKYEISLNDDSESDYSDYEIKITNTTNTNKTHEIVRVHDYDGGFEILRGEDFYATSKEDFIMSLFLNMFLTFVEV